MKGIIWDAVYTKIIESTQLKVFVGLLDKQLGKSIRDKRDFLYVDNGYFKRGARSRNFRLIRGGLHLTTILDRPSDRRREIGVNCKPWRLNGSHIVVIPPSQYHVEIYGAHNWLDGVRAQLKCVSDRKVLVKHDKKAPLPEALINAWAVVTYGSVAGVEAALLGIPVFSGPLCPTLPISAGLIENIESPHLSDPEPWLDSLAYANWSLDEIERIALADYDYDYRRVRNIPVEATLPRWRDACVS